MRCLDNSGTNNTGASVKVEDSLDAVWVYLMCVRFCFDGWLEKSVGNFPFRRRKTLRTISRGDLYWKNGPQIQIFYDDWINFWKMFDSTSVGSWFNSTLRIIQINSSEPWVKLSWVEHFSKVKTSQNICICGQFFFSVGVVLISFTF